MEKITQKRLYEEFDKVLEEINDIIYRKDIDAAKEVLKQISKMVKSNEFVGLDSDKLLDKDKDHILHKLLAEISGVIEVKEEKNLNEIILKLKEELTSIESEIGEGTATDSSDDSKLTEKKEKLEYKIKMLENIIFTTGAENLSVAKEKLQRSLDGIRKSGKLSDYESIFTEIFTEAINLLEELESEAETIDKIDLTEEAHKIGDNIFKTAEIRKELTERGVEREDFLRFYEEGKIAQESVIESINKDVRDLTELIRITDVEEKDGDIFVKELRDKEDDKKLEILEKIRNQLVGNEYGKEILKAEDEKFLTDEITAENMNDFIKCFNSINNKLKEEAELQKRMIDEQKENAEIFDKEISRLKKEIEVVKTSKEDLEKKSADEKELRKAQIKATMSDSEESKKIIEEWNKRILRFNEHNKKIKKFTYTKEGKEVELEYQTVEEYKEFADDEWWLNLEEYKDNLELTTKYEAIMESAGQDAALEFLKENTDPEKLTEMKSDNPDKSESEILMNLVAEKKEYVSTWHGHANIHAAQYSAYQSAGSTLKYMKPVKGQLPIQTKAANALENIGRFFGLRVPKFTKVNEEGKKVVTPNTIARGAITTAADIFKIGWYGLTKLPGAAAKGIMVLASMGDAKIYKNKYGKLIDANVPTLATTKEEKMLRRKEHYRKKIKEEKGIEELGVIDNLTTWAHAWTDRFPGRSKKAQETQDKVSAELGELSDTTIDRRTEKAVAILEDDKKIADRNLEKRTKNIKEEIRSADSYNDMVRDPKSIDKEKAYASAARNVILRQIGKNDLREDLNKDSEVARTKKYKKKEPEIEELEDLKDVNNKGNTIANTAITVEQRYTAAKQVQDRKIKFGTMLLTAGIKMGALYASNDFKIDSVIQDKGNVAKGNNSGPIKKWVEEKTKKVPIYEEKEVWTTEGAKGTFSEVAYNDVYGGRQISNTKLEDPIDAFALRIPGKDGEIVGDVSFAETATGLRVGGLDPQVTNIGDVDVSNMTMPQLMEHLSKENPEGFKQYLKAVGLKENASFEKIAKVVGKRGDLFGQTAKQEGWRQYKLELVKKVKREFMGNEEVMIEPGHYEVVSGGVQEVTDSGVVNRIIHNITMEKLIESIGKGAAIGAVEAGVDRIHEAVDPTKRVEEGTFEELNPLIASFAKKESERIKKEKEEEKDEEDKEKDKEDKGDER